MLREKHQCEGNVMMYNCRRNGLKEISVSEVTCGQAW